mmetsp:Transcript_42185/g.89246  ORF Transcript_42185/g.89246 Transcript_42185/m.89246 type:complete len:268 (-) Transcript_42185:123-926(-)
MFRSASRCFRQRTNERWRSEKVFNKHHPSIQKVPHPYWRPWGRSHLGSNRGNLFMEGKVQPNFVNRGRPDLLPRFDLGNQAQTSNRKYMAPAKAEVPPPRTTDHGERGEHWPDHWNTLNGRYRFKITGSFPEGGTQIESEVFRTCQRLGLVGWMRARGVYVDGHVQGNAKALMSLRKWIEERHMSPRCGRVDNILIDDQNFGITKLGVGDMEYRVMVSLKDWRKSYTKFIQVGKILERNRANASIEKAMELRYHHKEELDENRVRDW